MPDLSFLNYDFLSEHLLTVLIVIVTIVLFYNYFLDKNKVVGLSKKYKSSIYEKQSQIFLNATHYLISGEKDLAIKEFLNAVEINKETVDTYLTLGRLFRSNGEIDKAVSIHRSIAAREDILESTRLDALKELGKDFEKGGFLDKALSTYKDVLEMNKEQVEVIKSMCRILEDLEEWEEALKYRRLLSNVSSENYSDTISHIYVKIATENLEDEKYSDAMEKIEQAFRYAPSISAKILQLKIYLITGKMDAAKALTVEVLNEHEMFLSFMFQDLDILKTDDQKLRDLYFTRLKELKEFFLEADMNDADKKTSVFLSRAKMMKNMGNLKETYDYFKSWIEKKKDTSEIVKLEFLKVLRELKKDEEALILADSLITQLQKTSTNHFCKNCGYKSDAVFWRCPQCFEWETINFKVSL